MILGQGLAQSSQPFFYFFLALFCRLDAFLVLLLWLKVRCGGPGPIFCRPQVRKSKGVPSTVWDTHQKVSCDALTALVRELLADSGMLDVGKVATHSGKRTGVQLYEALGMSDSWVMDKGGWDSASAFVNYKSLSNRLEMRSSFLSAQAYSSK